MIDLGKLSAQIVIETGRAINDLKQFQKQVSKAEDNTDDWKDSVKDIDSSSISDLTDNTKEAQDETFNLNNVFSDLVGTIKDKFTPNLNFGGEVSGACNASISSLGKLGGEFAVVAAAAAAIIAAVKKISEELKKCVEKAQEFEDAYTDMQMKTSMSKIELEVIKPYIDESYAKGFGEDIQTVTDAYAIAKQQTDLDGTALQNLVEDTLLLTDVFGDDATSLMNAATMLHNTFGTSYDDAMNLIAQGYQKGANRNGNMLDSLNEYAPMFEKLGYSSEDFFNVIATGAQNGIFDVDKLCDGLKEFQIRASDGSAEEAFNLLGVSFDEFTQNFSQGGDTAKAAMEEVVSALMSVEDETLRNQIGVALFGTAWEDTGGLIGDTLLNTQNEISTTTGTMEEMAEMQDGTLSHSLEELKRTIDTSILKPIGEFLLPLVTSVVKFVTTKIIPIIGAVVKAILTIGNAVKTIVVKIADGIGEMAEIGKNIVEGLWKGISSAAGWLSEKINAFADMLPAVFKKILGIHSPSKVFEEIGENTMQGFLKGIENLEPTILKELSNFLNTIKSKYEKGVAEIDKQVSTMSNKLAETDLFTTIKDDDGVTTYQLNNFEDYIVLLEEYADLLDGLKAKGVDEDLLAEISDMNIEDAVGYMQQLTNLNDEDFNTYIANWEIKQKTAREIAEKYYKDSYTDLNKKFVQKIVDEMPVSFTEVGNDSGRNIINALIDSINGSKQQFLDVLDALVSEANEKLSEIDYEGGTTDGSHRTGLNEVPYDGYTAILHKGEMVLTQPEADRYQKGTKTALETVTQTNVNIEFKGSLAALGRVLKPIISKEETRVGKSLVEGA